MFLSLLFKEISIYIYIYIYKQGYFMVSWLVQGVGSKGLQLVRHFGSRDDCLVGVTRWKNEVDVFIVRLLLMETSAFLMNTYISFNVFVFFLVLVTTTVWIIAVRKNIFLFETTNSLSTLQNVIFIYFETRRVTPVSYVCVCRLVLFGWVLRHINHCRLFSLT